MQNAVSIDADIVGNIILLGPGAGKLPTASAVVEDLLHLFQEKSPRAFNGEPIKQGENESVPIDGLHDLDFRRARPAADAELAATAERIRAGLAS